MSHQKDYTTKETKWKHLSYEERQNIEYDYNNGVKVAEIARKLGKNRTTIKREIALGLYEHLDYNANTWDGKVLKYSADIAQNKRDLRNRNKGPDLKIGKDIEMSNELERLMLSGFSPYAAVQKSGVDLCCKTIYNYVEKGLFLKLTNKDLPMKGRIKKRGYNKIRKAENNRKGTSISERAEEINLRKTEGHWEGDLVVGKQGTKAVIFTLTERKTRKEIIRRLPNKRQATIKRALSGIRRKHGDIFKTITFDNGSEFLDSAALAKASGAKIFYAHPYSSWERGSNENANRMIRRFIPKGVDIGGFTRKRVQEIEDWINNYPRQILGGKSANELWICGKVA